MNDYMFAREIECLPREKLEALQFERLATTFRHAHENVPHYRQEFSEAGVAPTDLRGLEDLVKFPFTVKNDLRDSYPFGMFAVPREDVIRLHASSGTTGKPTVVGYTRADLEAWSDLMARTMACAGARPGDIIHNAYGYGLFTGGSAPTTGASGWAVRLSPSRVDLPSVRSC